MQNGIKDVRFEDLSYLNIVCLEDLLQRQKGEHHIKPLNMLSRVAYFASRYEKD